MDKELIYQDPAFLWAQLYATRALLMRVAQSTMTPEEFRQHGLQATESVRNAALPRAVPESFLTGLDDFDAWIKTNTA